MSKAKSQLKQSNKLVDEIKLITSYNPNPTPTSTNRYNDNTYNPINNLYHPNNNQNDTLELDRVELVNKNNITDYDPSFDVSSIR